MSKLVSLGQAPASFSRTPKFTDIDGTSLEVDVQYRYMTPTQHGALLDTLNAEGEVKPKRGAKPSTEAIYRAKTESNADYLMKIVSGWGLEDQLTRENMVAFLNRYSGATAAIAGSFYSAIHEGHAGN